MLKNKRFFLKKMIYYKTICIIGFTLINNQQFKADFKI